MTEVDYGGEGHRTQLKDQLINMCIWGAPSPVYKGVEEGDRPALLGAPQGEDSNPSKSRSRRVGRRRERKGKGSAAPHLVQFGLDGEGCGHPLRPFSPFPYGPLRPNTNSRNSPVLRKIPESLGTFPMSEYSHPIYDLYVSTILRLLVMFVISSGTPNNLRSPKHITHIIHIVIEG